MCFGTKIQIFISKTISFPKQDAPFELNKRKLQCTVIVCRSTSAVVSNATQLSVDAKERALCEQVPQPTPLPT